MKIKKTYQGVVPTGKVLNAQSNSQNDTYSCDYINKNGIAVQEEQPTMGEKIWFRTGIGNNKFNLSTSGTNYGISYGINGSTLTFNGTSTGSGNIISTTPYFTLEAGNYSIVTFNEISGTKSGFSSSKDMRLYVKNASGNTNIVSMGIVGDTKYSTTITLTSTTQVYLSMYCNSSGMSFTNYQIGIMVVKGSVQPTEYIEYEPKGIYINNNGTYELFEI